MTTPPPTTARSRARYSRHGLHVAAALSSPLPPDRPAAHEGAVRLGPARLPRWALSAGYLRLSDDELLLLRQRVALPDACLRIPPGALLTVDDAPGGLLLTLRVDGRPRTWQVASRTARLARTPALPDIAALGPILRAWAARPPAAPA